jgi:hypothetical protein
LYGLAAGKSFYFKSSTDSAIKAVGQAMAWMRNPVEFGFAGQSAVWGYHAFRSGIVSTIANRSETLLYRMFPLYLCNNSGSNHQADWDFSHGLTVIVVQN